MNTGALAAVLPAFELTATFAGRSTGPRDGPVCFRARQAHLPVARLLVIIECPLPI